MIRRMLNQALDKAHSQKYQTLNEALIYRENILNNFRVFRDLNPGAYVMTVLKSNAYGHGLKQVAEILNQVDSEFIAVDGYFEAHRIKDISRHKILVMGYILPDNIALLDNKSCSYVIQDIEGIRAFAANKRPFKIHLEINSGMNRLGIRPEEIADYLAELKTSTNLELEGVMTHLADADNPDPSFTQSQITIFDKAIEKIKKSGLEPKYIHVAQSAGSTKVKSKYANGIRIGIGLYGINPLTKKDSNYRKLAGLKPALEIQSTIIKTLDLKPGDRVSYNGIYKADKKATIAVLPLGYYEWVPREISDKGYFSAGTKKLPIRGRVCMNHTMIDISGTDLKVGDRVTVLSTNNSLNSVQALSNEYGLFTYHLLTRTTESMRRRVI